VATICYTNGPHTHAANDTVDNHRLEQQCARRKRGAGRELEARPSIIKKRRNHSAGQVGAGASERFPCPHLCFWLSAVN